MACFRHGFFAIVGHLHREPDIFEQAQGNLLIDRLIFDQQHPCPGITGLQTGFRTHARLGGGAGDGRAALAQAGGEPECAAFSGSALDTDLATHLQGQPFADGEAETGAAIFAVGRIVGLFERGKQALRVLGGNADALVPHFEAQEHRVGAFLGQSHMDADGALGGEFECVADQVQQDLRKAQGIALQRQIGNLAGQVGLQGQSFFRHPLADQADEVFQHFAKPEVDLFHRQAVGFDLGEIEDVVDDAQQVLGGLADLAELIDEARIGGFAQGQPGQADDGVHRGAQFVAHVGDEGALGPAGGFRLTAFPVEQHETGLIGQLTGEIDLVRRPSMRPSDFFQAQDAERAATGGDEAVEHRHDAKRLQIAVPQTGTARVVGNVADGQITACLQRGQIRGQRRVGHFLSVRMPRLRQFEEVDTAQRGLGFVKQAHAHPLDAESPCKPFGDDPDHGVEVALIHRRQGGEPEQGFLHAHAAPGEPHLFGGVAEAQHAAHHLSAFEHRGDNEIHRKAAAILAPEDFVVAPPRHVIGEREVDRTGFVGVWHAIGQGVVG